jgi:hypothetical protein
MSKLNLGDAVVRMAHCGDGIERIDHCVITKIDGDECVVTSKSTGLSHDATLTELEALAECFLA